MILGVVGLGLIGGSFAKAYQNAGHTVLALEKDETVYGFAELSGAVNGRLDENNAGECDLVLVCVYQSAAIEFLKKYAKRFGKKPVVIDCCGTKKTIVKEGMELAEKYGFCYVGGHPMAGTQYSGFKYSKANLFSGAPMVIVPKACDDIAFLDRVKNLLKPAGFGSISVTTAEKHDELIAFTSQLAHVVSSAYIKSPTALEQKGYSAGSYKDMTRVAWMNPEMWTELFLNDADRLVFEIDTLVKNLNDYKKALVEKDEKELMRLIEEGRARKKEVDG